MKIFVITAPSSAGKDSIVNKLKHKFHVPTSFTTRPKRDYEIDGKDYHFITKEEFYFKFNNNVYCYYKKNDGSKTIDNYELNNLNELLLEIYNGIK